MALPGFDLFYCETRAGRLPIQQGFCHAAETVVAIVQRGYQFLIGSQIPAAVPFQMAGKEVQNIAMDDLLRHLTGLRAARSPISEMTLGVNGYCLVAPIDA